MGTYETLLEEAVQDGAYVMECVNFESQSRGLIRNDVIGLSNRLQSNTERACILAEELGHYKTNTGNILNQSVTENRKQEKKARIWAYNKMVTLDKLIDAWIQGCRNRYEIAEYLEVTEDFLQDAIDSYRAKFGIMYNKGEYLIVFEPSLAIYRLVWNQAPKNKLINGGKRNGTY